MAGGLLASGLSSPLRGALLLTLMLLLPPKLLLLILQLIFAPALLLPLLLRLPLAIAPQIRFLATPPRLLRNLRALRRAEVE